MFCYSVKITDYLKQSQSSCTSTHGVRDAESMPGSSGDIAEALNAVGSDGQRKHTAENRFLSIIKIITTARFARIQNSYELNIDYKGMWESFGGVNNSYMYETSKN